MGQTPFPVAKRVPGRIDLEPIFETDGDRAANQQVKNTSVITIYFEGFASQVTPNKPKKSRSKAHPNVDEQMMKDVYEFH